MIGRLQGKIVAQGLDGTVVVDVSGVGYEVFAPMGSLGRLMHDQTVTLFVHTHVREDQLNLYGFVSDADRTAFRTVLGVSGIGPKLALAIVSALPAKELAAAISMGDRTVFKGIPGVGKKTVERLFLDLKDKLVAPGSSAPSNGGPAPTGPMGARASVLSALIQMGYKPAQAERAVAALGEKAQDEHASVEHLLREALASMA